MWAIKPGRYSRQINIVIVTATDGHAPLNHARRTRHKSILVMTDCQRYVGRRGRPLSDEQPWCWADQATRAVMSPVQTDTPQQLLDAAYRDLDLQNGDLLATANKPDVSLTEDEWRNKGEWLILGQRMHADRIFFVADDPVVVFFALPSSADEEQIIAAYRRAWSMGRARCLFLAFEGELRVYALNEPPPRTLADQQRFTPLEIVRRAADVADALAAYHRDRLESGLQFEKPEYLNRSGRSDERLLRDVTAATDMLEASGLPRPAAHALIERVILVRYLEDRKVIGPDYFARVARHSNAWVDVMYQPSEMPALGAQSIFVSCLSDREFTYAIFEELAETFNGDMFVVGDLESSNIEQSHLSLVQNMLTGGGIDGRNPLFLWAYDFSVVPTDLISSMYEQFYRAGTDSKKGTHYTPPELAEYVIAQALTPELLSRTPKVCDPACGSGIFLVEAFRRIVRDEMARTVARLSSEKLRAILLKRIRGIDINPEAIRLAAFSLYLAYLNYQDPPDINAAGPLPRLIYRPGDPLDEAVLVVADAFSPFYAETLPLDAAEYVGDANNDLEPSKFLPWYEQSFDLVIGNPPWDEPDEIPATSAESWAKQHAYPVGHRSPSQLFMWRALSFLKPRGIAALLVSAMVFHNVKSEKFRDAWLDSVALVSLVDFTSVRRMFFRDAAAPFALVIFKHASSTRSDNRLLYRNIRPSAVLQGTRSMAYARTDRQWIDQIDLQLRDYLWKTYAWGTHRDAGLMARLDAERQLDEIASDDPPPAWGYQRATGKSKIKTKEEASDYLKSIPSLRTFEIWGPIQPSWFEDPPQFVGRDPDERRYSGQRILITEGVRPSFGPYSRLVTGHYSFRHIIYCVPLPQFAEWQAKTLLAIFLSSLGRYRLFMRSGSWGPWHDKVNAQDILALPVRFGGEHDRTTLRITNAIDELSTVNMKEQFGAWSAPSLLDDLSTLPSVRNYKEILHDINQAVFDLFELSSAERDLINDFHEYTLDIAGNWRKSPGLQALTLPSVTAGTARDLPRVESHPIREYLDRFLSEWNRAIKPEGEFSWRVLEAPGSELIGAVFEPQDNESDGNSVSAEEESWRHLLGRLSVSLSYPTVVSVGIEGILRMVSDTSIVVIKRREARLWSASAAREDAEATMLQAIKLRDS